jgi:hypothetical protein
MAHTFIEHIDGKVLQRIVLTNALDAPEIDIQFQDRTAFHIQLDVQMRIELMELRDWKDGSGKAHQEIPVAVLPDNEVVTGLQLCRSSGNRCSQTRLRRRPDSPGGIQ